METVEIATEDGTRRVKARPCVVAGLCITGSRGDWRITHVASGKIVCQPSIYNTNITLSRIRNAVFAAESTGFILKDSVDWTANEAGLLAQSGLVLPWIRQVVASVATVAPEHEWVCEECGQDQKEVTCECKATVWSHFDY